MPELAAPPPALDVAPLLRPERVEDAVVVDSLIAGAFGPGRFAKSAERLREGNTALTALSFVAWRGDEAVGCVRLWPVMIGDVAGLLLGPIAVDEAARSQGVGAALVERACEAGRVAGQRVILLVGDDGFFGPLGFSAALARGVRLPGPVDPRRVLARYLGPDAPPRLSGLVRPA